MSKRTCIACGKEITERNDSMWIRRLLSDEEYQRYNPFKKDVCVDCKKEMLYANIIAVV
jgi:hypothetical protein